MSPNYKTELIVAYGGSIFPRVPLVSWATRWSRWSSLSLFSRCSIVPTKTTRTLFSWSTKRPRLSKWSLLEIETFVRCMWRYNRILVCSEGRTSICHKNTSLQEIGLIFLKSSVTFLNFLFFFFFLILVKYLQVDLVDQLVLQTQGNQWAPGDRSNILRFRQESCKNGSLFYLKGPCRNST